jgi:hypothetical protein
LFQFSFLEPFFSRLNDIANGILTKIEKKSIFLDLSRSSWKDERKANDAFSWKAQFRKIW